MTAGDVPRLRPRAVPVDDDGMADVWIALAAAFVLAFVVAGPKVRKR
jgi:hypothetical protein